jgi:hypothetical protein
MIGVFLWRCFLCADALVGLQFFGLSHELVYPDRPKLQKSQGDPRKPQATLCDYILFLFQLIMVIKGECGRVGEG